MSQKVETEWLEKSSCIFYKLIVASILHDKKLKMPSKFAAKYGNEFGSIATLTSQNGRVWLVELEKVNQNIWFKKGWHEFVEHCSIQAGYFVVFRYEGKSNFNVHIFNLSACEVKSPSNALSNSQDLSLSHAVKETNSDNEKKTQGNGVCDIKIEFESNDDMGASGLYVPAIEAKPPKRIRLSGDSDPCELFDVPIELMVSEDHKAVFSRRGRAVTPQQKDQTFKVASMFSPENPSCTIILRPSYVYKGLFLHLPRWFAQRYLTGISRFIRLICKEKQWLVRCVNMKGKAKLSSGWPAFVWENDLGDGDVCVFELINIKNIALKVTVFKVLEVAGSVN